MIDRVVGVPRSRSITGIRSSLTTYTRVVSAPGAGSTRLSTVSTAVNTMTEIHLEKSDSITRAVGERRESSPARITRPGTSMETPEPTPRERQ